MVSLIYCVGIIGGAIAGWLTACAIIAVIGFVGNRIIEWYERRKGKNESTS